MDDQSLFAVTTYNKIADIYTRQYFDDLTDTPWIDKFLAYLPDKAKILDVGCGPGEFAKYLLGKSDDVIGVDLSEEMIKIAKERVDGEHFSVMDMRHLAFDKETFDGVLVAYSLIHIPTNEVTSTLQEFHRVLKPGGFLMTITQQGEPDHIVDEPLMQGEKMFINFFTSGGIEKEFRDAGFEVAFQEEVASQDPDSLSKRVIYTIGRRI